MGGENHVKNCSCIMEPEQFKYRSLGYVLHQILSNIYGSIDIYLGDCYTSDETENVEVNNTQFDTPKNITISCWKQCHIQLNLSITSTYFSPGLLLSFANATIVFSSFALQNVQVHFQNVILQDSFVSDATPKGDTEKFLKGEIVSYIGLWFYNVTFHHTSPFHPLFDLNIGRTNQFSCHFVDTKMQNIHVRLMSKRTLITAVETSFVGDGAFVMVDETLFVNFDSVTLTCLHHLCLNICARQVKVEVQNLTLQSSKGGIVFVNDARGTTLLAAWMQITIVESTFQNNTLIGPGGALQFQIGFMTHKSFVNITKCLFFRNVLLLNGMLDSVSAAIGIENLYSSDKRTHSSQVQPDKVFVKIKSSRFIDNFAENGGGSIFFRGESVSVTIDDCEFALSESMPTSSRANFILGSTEVCINNSSIKIEEGAHKTRLVALEMPLPSLAVRCLNLNIKCAAWHRISGHISSMNTTTNDTIMHEAVVNCKECPATRYIPSDGSH